mmetsp:Transcript_54106/g.166479  ORF Transcript_54106/g.166479 Transcript_54106/m.166479 type:complete len:319 (+) Transcript_54106:106-1062(+)
MASSMSTMALSGVSGRQSRCVPTRRMLLSDVGHAERIRSTNGWKYCRSQRGASGVPCSLKKMTKVERPCGGTIHDSGVNTRLPESSSRVRSVLVVVPTRSRRSTSKPSVGRVSGSFFLSKNDHSLPSVARKADLPEPTSPSSTKVWLFTTISSSRASAKRACIPVVARGVALARRVVLGAPCRARAVFGVPPTTGIESFGTTVAPPPPLPPVDADSGRGGPRAVSASEGTAGRPLLLFDAAALPVASLGFGAGDVEPGPRAVRAPPARDCPRARRAFWCFGSTYLTMMPSPRQIDSLGGTSTGDAVRSGSSPSPTKVW